MRARSIDVGILLIGLFIGLVCATQYIASGFAYDVRLGFEVLRWRQFVLYWPVAGIYWIFTPLYHNGPLIFDRAEFAFCACFAVAVFLVAIRRGTPGKPVC
jgi:hypothetical protein